MMTVMLHLALLKRLIDIQGKIPEKKYNPKTSTELLTVLNRIWALEEQHASNILVMKALKKELRHAHTKIKDLIHEWQADRLKIDELVKQIVEGEYIKKIEEQDRITAVIESVREEMVYERKLRRHSESLRKRLTQELYQIKTSLLNASKQHEKERRSRWLLELLCDEFALGIKTYEQEMHALRSKSSNKWVSRTDQDGLILHISESCLDERIQMKQEPEFDFQEKYSAVDKLRSDIAAFLQIKHNDKRMKNDNFVSANPSFPGNSLESIPLNMAFIPQNDDAEEQYSSGCDSHCLKLTNNPKCCVSNLRQAEADDKYGGEMLNLNCTANKGLSKEKARGHNPSSLQLKFEERMACAVLHTNKKVVPEAKQVEFGKDSPFETRIYTKSQICEVGEKDTSDRKNKADGTAMSSPNYKIDNSSRCHMVSESQNIESEIDFNLVSCGNSTRQNQASPLRQWTTEMPSEHVAITELNKNLPPELKENTLKAMLLKARTRRRLARPGLKAYRTSF